MTLKANMLLRVFILMLLLCIGIVGLTCTTSLVSANAADDKITVFQNDNIVEYSAKSYIDNTGKFNNFTDLEGEFSNALYKSLEIKINNTIVAVEPMAITVTNHNEIKLPKTYTLNLRISYGEKEYTINDIAVKIEEKSLDNAPIVRQTKEVRYNAMSYMANGTLIDFAKENEPFLNPLYSTISFKVDDNEINESLNPSEIFFFDTDYGKITNLKEPKIYKFNILFDYLGNSYLIKNVEVELKKCILDVSVELSGQLNLSIKEGENYNPRIVYSGFLGNDTASNALIYPATIPNEPKRPIENYEIRAENALSKYYEMNYISSYITITANPIEEITYTSATEDLLILRGSYSPYCDLEFIDVGVSLASITFTEINNTLQRFYSNNSLLDKYKPIASYRINLKVNEENEELAGSHISIKMDERLMGHDEYYVVTLTNDGVYQVVSATTAHGYLSFYTADLGDFVVLAPIKGINTTQFVIIAFSLFAGIALCIILFAVFRRKY